MENPEEVLQALDEFQKLRPADIPKELEEYLSWVAKTGDPVYQWPLIKALFREKLLRVMTEFYESCPTLELAPCPNVEQFNYDMMKSALLDRLESFSNAPFTVQRICELLTAPRKEYNRVDKFMRAIEKNILVVSTREPGPAARRSENGDGMVNGSTEDNGSRSPYDMDLWARACTLATTVTVQTVETHSTIVNIHHLPTNIIPATELTIVKSSPVSVEAFTPYGADSELCDSEITAKGQDLPSTFTPSTSEIANIANLTSQIQPQDLNSTSGIQNLSNMVPEPSNIVGDVPEAIMNEDTNSQPSLDMENNENEAFESTKTLQTTFQSSDFISHGIKPQKFYSEEAKSVEKTIVQAESIRNDLEPLIELTQKPAEDNTDVAKVTPEIVSSGENGEPAIPATVITADSIEMTENIDEATNAETIDKTTEKIKESNDMIQRNISGDDQMRVKECVTSDNDNNVQLKSETESALLDINIEKDSVSCAKISLSEKEAEVTLPPVTPEPIIPCTVETRENVTQNITISKETEITTDSKELNVLAKETEQIMEETLPTTEGSKRTDEFEESTECLAEKEKISDCVLQLQTLTTIKETSDENDTKITKSIVPDPLPIVEEPKEEVSVPDLETKQLIVDVTNEEHNTAVNTASSPGEKEKELIDTFKTEDALKANPDATDAQSGQAFLIEKPSSVVTNSALVRGVAPVESMEVDIAEGNQTVQQDEPMEQEVSDLDKS
ncbi:serine/threonine-protein phosphatase 4 regulatory subunit 2 [Neodiprion virginianus]|uniref:serine/threonine-protein phosphatase 4 regulatory subunit 2 n=1 Tax=Neodiprion virginianus TaxID=2961670 RepID=UPI001EE7018D|nr:serine/threonine-protein phosphatase 4 regulatory subunit 2 [Neodiprion virginianus]